MSWKQILLLAAVISFGMVAVPKEQNDKDAIRHMATGGGDASTKTGRSNSSARFLGRERRFFANADVTVLCSSGAMLVSTTTRSLLCRTRPARRTNNDSY